MYFKENQMSSLRQKTYFRICSFAITVAFGGYMVCCRKWYFKDGETLENIFIGASCSLFVWLLVELWDLSVDVYSRCMSERRKFFEIIVKAFYNWNVCR